MIRTLGRFAAAAVLAVGLLAATAVPASATVHDLVITSGTIVIGTTTSSLGGHHTFNTCALNSFPTTVIPVNLNSTGGGSFTSYTTTEWGDFVVGTNTFKSRWLITSGTISITTTTITMSIFVRAEFRNCASTTPLCTTNAISITLTGYNGTGSLHPGAGSSFSVSGTSTAITVQAAPSCNVIIRAAILNKTSTVSLNTALTT